MSHDIRHFLDILNEAAAAAAPGYDLKKKYDEFNIRLFGGKLPDIPLEWANLKHVGGVANVKIMRDPNVRIDPMRVRLGLQSKYDGAKIVPGSMNIRISALFKRSEQALDGILLHEMIHIKLFVDGDLGHDHDGAFEHLRRELSQKIGFEIPRTDSTAGLELNSEKTKTIGVVLLHKKDGSYSCGLMSDKNITAFLPEIEEHWKHLVKYNYAERATVYLVNSPPWTAAAARLTISRKAKDMKFFVVKDDQLVTDLQQNGKVLADITKVSGAD